MSEKSKIWGEMTDEEKSALLLAEHEGRTIQQFFDSPPWATWFPKDKTSPFQSEVAYRIAPFPGAELVKWMTDASIDPHPTLTDALTDDLIAAEARIAELEKALARIDEASNHYALITTYSEGTLRYAHQSTRNIAREALKTKGGE